MDRGLKVLKMRHIKEASKEHNLFSYVWPVLGLHCFTRGPPLGAESGRPRCLELSCWGAWAPGMRGLQHWQHVGSVTAAPRLRLL